MSSTKPIKSSNEVDVSKIVFNEAETVNKYNPNSNCKNVYYSYNGGKGDLTIETPYMKIPAYGLSEWAGNDGKDPKYTLDLSFASGITTDENITDIEHFDTLVKDMDQLVLEKTLKNSFQYMKKKITNIDIIAELYTRMYKVSKDKKTGEPNPNFPATFKLNVPFKDGVCEVKVVDGSGELIDIKDVNTKGATAKAIIMFSGLWFAGGKFGCSWKLKKLMIISKESNDDLDFKTLPFPKAENPRATSSIVVAKQAPEIQDQHSVDDIDIDEDDDCVVPKKSVVVDKEDEDEEEDDIEPKRAKPTQATSKAHPKAVVDDSEEEEDEDEDDEVEKKKVTKTITINKKR